MSGEEAREVLEATRLFLVRHEEALRSGLPELTREAARSLLAGVEVDLPEALQTVPPIESPARAVVAKRLAEVEGLALQLDLLLHEEPRPGIGQVMRLAKMLAAITHALDDLRATLVLWARERGAATPTAADIRALLGAARASLRADAPEAAAVLLRRALRLGLAAPLGAAEDPPPVADALRMWIAAGGSPRFSIDESMELDRLLDGEARRDPAAAWLTLDAIERLVNGAAMTPVDEAARARALAVRALAARLSRGDS